MNPFLVSTTSSLVLISLASMAFIFSYQRNSDGYSKFGIGFTALATILLSVDIIRYSLENQQLISTSILFSAVLGLMTLLGHLVFQMKLSGIFTLPIASLLLLLDLFSGEKIISTSAPYAGVRDIHIITAIIGQAMAIGAFAIALMYLWQHRNLKRKLLDQISDKVPALDRLSKLLNISLWIGLIFLTTALISGAYYTSHSEVATGLGLKVFWAIGVWLWYMAILVVKNVLKRPTTFVAKLSVAGFFILAISLFGISIRPVVGM